MRKNSTLMKKHNLTKWSAKAGILAVIVAATAATANGVVYVDDFEGGANASGWNWVFATSTVTPAGGNPDGYLDGDQFQGFNTPQVETTAGAVTPFHGDYRTLQVTQISFDTNMFSNQFGVDLAGYGFTGSLTLRDNDTGDEATYSINDPAIGNPGGGWVNAVVPIPSQDALPGAGWTVLGDWNNVIQGVDEVNFDTFDPYSGFTSIGLTAHMGVDNMTINYVPEPGSLALLGLGGFALVRRRRSVVW